MQVTPSSFSSEITTGHTSWFNDMTGFWLEAHRLAGSLQDVEVIIKIFSGEMGIGRLGDAVFYLGMELLKAQV
jgi:hypothetical protein